MDIAWVGQPALGCFAVPQGLGHGVRLDHVADPRHRRRGAPFQLFKEGLRKCGR